MEMFIKMFTIIDSAEIIIIFNVIVGLTVSYNRTVVYVFLFCFFLDNLPLSFSPSVDLRNFFLVSHFTFLL